MQHVARISFSDVADNSVTETHQYSECCMLEEILPTRYMKLSGSTVQYSTYNRSNPQCNTVLIIEVIQGWVSWIDTFSIHQNVANFGGRHFHNRKIFANLQILQKSPDYHAHENFS